MFSFDKIDAARIETVNTVLQCKLKAKKLLKQQQHLETTENRRKTARQHQCQSERNHKICNYKADEALLALPIMYVFDIVAHFGLSSFFSIFSLSPDVTLGN